MPSSKNPIIPCELRPETKNRIAAYAEALIQAAPSIGDHGLNEQDFWDSGLFRSAIERLRGTQAAFTADKRRFMESVLDFLAQKGEIEGWVFAGNEERHDYEIVLPGGWLSVVETKGCLDGNNTNIFERPPHADEFVIWSLCQNPGSDPRHNAWSGIHTRLSAEEIHRSQRIDGVVIWDLICGTVGRPCPKLANPERATLLANGRAVPPPCLYLFPRSLPNPRNNPHPAVWKLEEVRLLHTLWKNFQGRPEDLIQVQIETRMEGADIQRRTRFTRQGEEFSTSGWTTIRRAR